MNASDYKGEFSVIIDINEIKERKNYKLVNK